MGISISRTGALLTGLGTDKNFYSLGEPVRLTLFKINISSRPVTLTYPSSQKYDFSVSTFSGEIWRWSAGQIFLPVVEQITLLPGQSLSYSETWPQVTNRGFPVPPGIYRLTGWNTAEGIPPFHRPSTFIRIGF